MASASRLAGAAVVAVLLAAWTQGVAAETIVIGCLERAGQGVYQIKDYRSGNPFRIQGDNSSPEKTLDWQVGQQLEVHGTIDAQQNRTPLVLKATSIIRISRTCPQTPAGQR
jgi:hypothetical protein